MTKIGQPGHRTLQWTIAGALLFAAHAACAHAVHDVRSPFTLYYGLYVVGAAVVVGWYALLLRSLGGWGEMQARVRSACFGIAVLIAGAHLATPPRGSIDATTYVVHGYIQAELGGDVYSESPSAVLEGPLRDELLAVGYGPWHDGASPYGPVWSLVEATVWRITGEVRAALFAFQFIGLLALVACAVALAGLVSQRRAELAPGAVALAFLLLPIAPAEAVLDAHLDVSGYAFVLFALFAAGTRRGRSLAPLLLAIAINIKLTFALFVPVTAVLGSAGKGVGAAVRTALAHTASIVLVTVLLYSLYWKGTDTLAPVTEHAGRLWLTTPLTLAAGATALLFAARMAHRAEVATEREAHAGRGDPNPARATVVPLGLLTAAYWLPWYGLPLAGELLRCGGRWALAGVLYLSLMGRWFTGSYFDMQYALGEHHPWVTSLLLPGEWFQLLTLVAVGCALIAVLVRRARSFASVSGPVD